MSKYLTAENARANVAHTHSIDGEYKRKETNKVMELITGASLKGYTTIQTLCTDPIIIKRLEHLGYAVVYHSDQRDGDYLEITW